MARVFIGLGSNLGDRLQFLQRSVGALVQLPTTVVRKVSSVFETEPVGMKDQPEFLNAVVELETSIAPRELFHLLKKIERSIGRTKRERWRPREIDLDLLYYGAEILHDAELRIPHTEIQNRRFVLQPLSELASEFVDPVRNITIQQSLQICTDTTKLKKTSFKLMD